MVVTLYHEIDIEVYCDCGAVLSAEFDDTNVLIVEPCESCMEEARQEGRDEE